MTEIAALSYALEFCNEFARRGNDKADEVAEKLVAMLQARTKESKQAKRKERRQCDSVESAIDSKR